ncbi:cytochrome P450 [Nocardia sp. NPDC001965]
MDRLGSSTYRNEGLIMSQVAEIIVTNYSDLRRPHMFYDPATPPTIIDGVVHVFSRSDVTRVLQNDERIFSRQLGPKLPDPHPTFRAPWGLDWYPLHNVTGRHTHLHSVIAPWFRATAIKTIGPEIQAALTLLLDAVIVRGEADLDLATEIAYPLALQASGMLLGLDLEQTDWREKLNTHLAAPSFDQIPRQHDVDAAIWQIVAERLISGESRGQLVDRLIDGWRDGDIEKDDIVPIIWMSLVAATDTTAASLVSMIGLLDEFDLLDQIRAGQADDRLIAGAVEESLRLGQVFDSTATLCTEATRIGSIDVPPYTLVVAWYSAANRDTVRGNEFDIARRPNTHVTFGPPQDPHVCLGAAMSRYILRIALREVSSRFSGLRRNRSKPTRQIIGITNRFASAPFTYDPSPR